MEKIITALDYAKREGASTVRERIALLCQKRVERNLLDTPMKGEPTGKVIKAEINFGQWIAKCPDCNGAEAVDPSEPIFYCFSCGNYKQNGRPRKVEFPKDREEIEKLVLARPIKIGMGTHNIERVTLAKPTIWTKFGPLSRSWVPGETVADLKKQNEDIK